MRQQSLRSVQSREPDDGSDNPLERSFDEPPFRQHLKSSSVRSIDDLQVPGTIFSAPHRHRHLASRVCTVSKNAFDEREWSSRPAQQVEGAVAVLNMRPSTALSHEHEVGVSSLHPRSICIGETGFLGPETNRPKSTSGQKRSPRRPKRSCKTPPIAGSLAVSRRTAGSKDCVVGPGEVAQCDA